jgi:ferredoxin
MGRDAGDKGEVGITEGGWICPSTRAFVAEARQTPGFSWLDLLHGYAYARWPYLYIGVGTGRHPLVRWIKPFAQFVDRLFPRNGGSQEGARRLADRYHGKVLPPDAARQLVTVGEEVRLTDLEQVIPYPLARDIILKNPEQIVALECPCRASVAEPCQPLDVCLVVGEPFAGFIAAHHPRRARWVDAAEAMEILEAEHAQGHVHHAFFNDAMLGRFFGICNCCRCCCGAMQAHQRGTPMLASSGYVAAVDAELCAACGLCADDCPFAALVVDHGHAVVDYAACMGCGVCVSHCPEEAISLQRDPAKGAPLEIQELLAHAA